MFVVISIKQKFFTWHTLDHQHVRPCNLIENSLTETIYFLLICYKTAPQISLVGFGCVGLGTGNNCLQLSLKNI